MDRLQGLKNGGAVAFKFTFGRVKGDSKVSNQPVGSDALKTPSPYLVHGTRAGAGRSSAPNSSKVRNKDPKDTQVPFDGSQASISQPKLKMTFSKPFISDKFVTWYGYGVLLGNFLGIQNYHWDKGENRLRIRPRQSCEFQWWLGTVSVVAYFIFVMVQLMLRLASYDALDFDKLLLSYTLVLTSLPLVFLTVSALHEAVIVDFVNHAIGFCNEYAQLFDAEYCEKETMDLRIATMFLQWVYVNMGAVILLWIAGSVAMPELCHYISTLCLDPSSSCYIPLRIANVVLMAPLSLLSVAHCATYLTGVAVIILMKPTIGYLNILRERSSECGPRELLHLYRQLVVIFEEMNEFCSMLIFPSVENILIALTVFGIYGALRTGGVIRTVMIGSALIAYGILMIMFWALGKIHTGSSQVLATWRRDLRFSKRDMRSVRPIRIRLAYYAHVDNGILLTIMDLIINYSINLLIITA